MASISFFEAIEQHYQNKLPFVVFRNPNETKLTAFLDLGTSANSETKFIVSPFDSSDYFTIHSHKILNIDYNSIHSTSKSDEIEWIDLEIKKNNHIQLIGKALSSIQTSPLKKVVLATSLEFDGASKSPFTYLKTILSKYTNTFNYLLFYPWIWIGLGITVWLVCAFPQSW